MNHITAYLEPGLIDHLKEHHRFNTDTQLAAALRCTEQDIENLRQGAEPTYPTILAIAAITGRESLDFVRPVMRQVA